MSGPSSIHEVDPATLAAIRVLATDIDATESRARDWIETGQHVANTDALYRPHLQDRAGFDAMVCPTPE